VKQVKYLLVIILFLAGLSVLGTANIVECATCTCPYGGTYRAQLYTSLCGWQYNVCVTFDYNCANDYRAVCTSTGYTVTVNVVDSTGRAIAGASVRLDGVSKGTTNYLGKLMISSVTRGYHTLSMSKTGYQTVTQQAYVSGNMSVTSRLSGGQPTPTGYTVAVNVRDSSTGAVVAGATVYLDGIRKGTTDYLGRLTITGVARGSHTIGVSKTGYGAATQQVYVARSTSLTILLPRS